MAARDRKKIFIGFDRVVAILTIPIAIFLIYLAYSAPRSNIRQTLGPEAMPIAVLSLIIVCAVFIFINSTAEKEKTTPPTDAAAPPSIRVRLEKYKTVVLVVFGLLVYGAMLEPVGFVISTTLLVFYSAQLFEKEKWVRNLIVSSLFSLSVYYSFVHLLDVLLPEGILWF